MNTDDPRAELCEYMLALGDEGFRYQHVVDALTAQEADTSTAPMRLTFALLGLYLRVERRYTGRQVQRVHSLLAQRRPAWPRLVLPLVRGALTAADVLAAPAGPAREAAIDAWCAAVWAAYGASQTAVVSLAEAHGLT